MPETVLPTLSLTVGISALVRSCISTPRAIYKSGRRYVFDTSALLNSDPGMIMDDDKHLEFVARVQRLLAVTDELDDTTKKFLDSWSKRKAAQNYKVEAEKLYIASKIYSENLALEKKKCERLRQKLENVFAHDAEVDLIGPQPSLCSRDSTPTHSPPTTPRQCFFPPMPSERSLSDPFHSCNAVHSESPTVIETFSKGKMVERL